MSKDPHEPFDKVTMTTPDGKETDITNAFNGEAFDLEGDGDTLRMWPETDAEREAREAFYSTTPSRARERVDGYIHSIKVSGSLRLEDKLENLDLVSVSIADADGTVIASGMGEISVGFKKNVTKDATIMERGHTAKLA